MNTKESKLRIPKKSELGEIGLNGWKSLTDPSLSARIRELAAIGTFCESFKDKSIII